MADPSWQTEVELQIPFHDVDAMGVAWHGHYAKYFEIARCELLEQIDFSYDQMVESGYTWPVIDLHIRYVKPARFGQRVLIRARIVEWENRLKINYLIRDNATNTRLTKGHSIQVAVDNFNEEMLLVSPPVLFEKLGIEGL